MARGRRRGELKVRSSLNRLEKEEKVGKFRYSEVGKTLLSFLMQTLHSCTLCLDRWKVLVG